MIKRKPELLAPAGDPQALKAAGLIKGLFPDFPLHASTQMTVHNAAGVKFLEDMGFQRVILAREVGLADIIEIRKKSLMELEVFVHGALCFCYPGQHPICSKGLSLF
jgi:putative protease